MFHSYIIAGNTHENRQKYIEQFIKQLKISTYDLTRLTVGPVTIAQIRIVIQFLNRKPLSSPYKGVIIQADAITREAQQALLKTLEEPPANSLVILSVNNENSLLPTIISRCTVKKLFDEKNAICSYDFDLCKQFWQKIFTTKKSTRLVQTNVITTDRENALSWITQQMSFFRNELINAYLTPRATIFPSFSSYYVLRQMQKTYEYLKGNITTKLAIDQLFLNI